jgi:hypothetical protein
MLNDDRMILTGPFNVAHYATSEARLVRRALAAWLVVVALVANHRGEFCPFSIYPTESRRKRSARVRSNSCGMSLGSRQLHLNDISQSRAMRTEASRTPSLPEGGERPA